MSGRFCARFGWVHELSVLACLLAPSCTWAQEQPAAEKPENTASLSDGFESPQVIWREEQTDTSFLLKTHERSEIASHEGSQSERFVFEAGPGSVLYYSYRLPRLPLTDTLHASLYVRSNRTGVRIYGRVVLPEEKDPETGQPAYLLISGTSVETPDRWQRLELSGLPLAVNRQAAVLRAGSNRPVSLNNAYLDRLVINLYGGPGSSEVFVDELNVSPVPQGLGDSPNTEEDPASPESRQPGRGSRGISANRVTMEESELRRDGKPWLPRGISAPGADLASIRRAGFDVVEMPFDADAEEVKKSIDLGYLVMPRLAELADTPDKDALEAASRFPNQNGIAFWNLGDQLGRANNTTVRTEELQKTRKRAYAIENSTEIGSKLSFASVVDQFPKYADPASHLNIIGVEYQPFAGALDPADFYRDLRNIKQSVATKNLKTLFWAWIPASANPAIRKSVWGEDVPPGWGWPAVQPDQIRMLTYAALMAGYRGLGFRSDAELGRPGGLARLYELTLLIAEIELLEPFLASSITPPGQSSAFPPDPKINLVYNPRAGTAPIGGGGGALKTPTPKENAAYPTVKVAAFDTNDHRTKILLVADLAFGGQWQPPQMGYRDMNLLIPGPESAQAFEVSLGDVQALESRRDTGGRRITIPVFNGTAIVVLTTDLGLIDRLRANVHSLRPRAVDIAIKLAEIEYQQVANLNNQMTAQGIAVRNSSDLLEKARRMLLSAQDAMERQDYAAAWIEARSLGQPLRMVSRAYFDRAYRELVAAIDPAEPTEGSVQKRPRKLVLPVALPPMVSRETMPQYAYWLGFIRGSQGAFGSNRIPSGNFDLSLQELGTEGWSDASHRMDKLESGMSIDRSQGVGPVKTSLKLSVKPKQLPDRDKFEVDGRFNAAAYKKAMAAVVDSISPIHTLPVVAVRSPSIQVKARDFVRIRVMVRMPRSQVPGSTGLIVRDNLGGDNLQFQTSGGLPQWSEVVLYRRAAVNGEFFVTLGLAGIGDAYFDDLRVEVLGDSDSTIPEAIDRAEDPLARRPTLPDPRTPVVDPNNATVPTLR